MEGTLIELSPAVIELIEQIIENQGDDITAENLQIIADGMYTEVEGVTVSLADLLYLQNQQLLEVKEQQAIIDKRLDSEFLTLNDGIGVLGAGIASVFVWEFFKHIFGGVFHV